MPFSVAAAIGGALGIADVATATLVGGALLGGGLGAGTSALTGGNVLEGAGAGALGGLLVPAGAGIGGSLLGDSLGSTAAGAIGGGLGGALGGAGSSLFTGANPLNSALEGGVGGALTGGLAGYNGNLPDLSNFSEASGLSGLLGGTAEATSNLENTYGGITSGAPIDAATTASATNPVTTGSLGATNGSYTAGAASPGSAGVGGGTLAGFGADPSSIGEQTVLGSSQGGANEALSPTLNAADPTLAGGAGVSGVGGPANLGAGTQNFLNNLPSTGGTADALNPAVINASNASTQSFQGTPDISLNQQGAIPSMMGSTTPIAQSGGNNMSGLSSLLGGGASNPLNGIANAGLGYLLNKPNTAGMNGINAATQAEQANLKPFLTAGTGAENQLSNLYGNNGQAAETAAMNNFQTTPGYNFEMGQGINAINANNAATGNVESGNAQEAINNYAQGTADQQYNNYVNQLQNLASGGMSAAGASGTAGLTGAGALAQLGQNKSNAANTAVGTGLQGLFPTGMSLAQLLGSLGGSGGGIGSGAGNQGLWGLLQGNA